MKKKILIIANNQSDRSVLNIILADDYIVIEATADCMVLDTLRKNQQNMIAVLLDFVAPEINAYEFLCEIKKDPKLNEIPILVSTQTDNLETQNNLLKLGVDGFILKPYEPQVIKQRIKNILLLKENAVLRNSVRRDKLTGVLNKDTFYSKVKRLINETPSTDFEIVCFDIEKFKIVNELYGVSEGNRLIIFLAHMLKEKFLPPLSDIGKLGPDVFAVCCEKGQYNWTNFSENIQTQLSSYPLNMTIIVKLGIYDIEDRTIPISAMCDRATLAIKTIKGKYNENVSFYDDINRKQLIAEQEITSEMHRALLSDEFCMYIQPKYDLTTESIIGGEALVRWIHPSKGIIPPCEFIPLFEKNGFITTLDAYIWEKACATIKEWIDNNITPVPISINVSRVDIYNPNLCNILEDLINKYNIPHSLLELEITETSYTENAEQLISTVNNLKSRGFSIHMDDFGNGYSSLNMLNEVPVDVIKLDMRFLQSNQNSARQGNILNFVVGLAKWMEVPVIAEGIETSEQSSFLRSIGCNKGQGFLFSKPLPKSEFTSLIENSNISTSPISHHVYFSTTDLLELTDPFSRFNWVFHHSISALAIFELKGTTLSLFRGNDHFYSELSLSPNKLYAESTNLLASMCDEDKQNVLNTLSSARLNGMECSVKLRLSHPSDNKERWYLAKIKVIYDSNETALYLGSISDISKIILLENCIDKQNRLLKRIYESSSTGITQLSYDTFTLINANPAAYEILGIAQNDSKVTSHNLLDYIHPDFTTKATQSLERLNTTSDDSFTIELMLNTSKGDEKWIVMDCANFPADDDMPSYHCIFVDISKSKRADKNTDPNHDQSTLSTNKT